MDLAFPFWKIFQLSLQQRGPAVIKGVCHTAALGDKPPIFVADTAGWPMSSGC
jgi:hypothetical protein